MKKALNILSAELLKTKSSAVPWIALATMFFTVFLVYMGHRMDIHSMARIGLNPWKPYFVRMFGMMAFFIATPTCVLLAASFIYIEQRANAPKYLYSLPVHRSSLYFSKLFMLVAYFGVAFVMILVITWLSGMALGLEFPEYEFFYNNPDWWRVFELFANIFIASLGILGFQYLMSIFFKNLLFSIGIGLVLFVIAFVLTASTSSFAVYVPHTFPLIIQDYGMMNTEELRTPIEGIWMNDIGLRSITFFVLFTILGWAYETRREVS